MQQYVKSTFFREASLQQLRFLHNRKTTQLFAWFMISEEKFTTHVFWSQILIYNFPPVQHIQSTKSNIDELEEWFSLQLPDNGALLHLISKEQDGNSQSDQAEASMEDFTNQSVSSFHSTQFLL